jgi:hypothetical protein
MIKIITVRSIHVHSTARFYNLQQPTTITIIIETLHKNKFLVKVQLIYVFVLITLWISIRVLCLIFWADLLKHKK